MAIHYRCATCTYMTTIMIMTIAVLPLPQQPAAQLITYNTVHSTQCCCAHKALGQTRWLGGKPMGANHVPGCPLLRCCISSCTPQSARSFPHLVLPFLLFAQRQFNPPRP